VAIIRPSARVQLVLRLEEYADDGSLRRSMGAASPDVAAAASEAVSSTLSREMVESKLSDVGQAIEILQNNPDDLPPSILSARLAALRAQRETLLAQAGVPAAGTGAEAVPSPIGGPSPDDRVVLGSIIPLSVQIERNSIRQADQASVTISHSDAPFDPRLIRAAAIEITLGVVDASDYEAGVAGERRDDGSLVSMVGRSRTLTGTDSRLAGTTRFVGWVDSWTISYDDQDGDTISLECRDLSAICFDTPLATGTGVDLSQPIDRGVRSFLKGYAELRGIEVVYGRPGQRNAGTPPVPLEAVPPISRARRGRVAQQRRSGDQRQSVWDHLTDVTAKVGLIPIVYDYQLHIVEARTYFVGRDVARRMVYGRNLSHLEFARKLGGVKVPTIEVRCYDATLGRTRWARWPSPPGSGFGVFGETSPPTTPQRPNETSVSGHDPSERIQTYLVTGVTSGELLQRVARNLFDSIGRQEIEGNWETYDVQSYSESEEEGTDLLALDSGDAVEILIAGGPRLPYTTGPEPLSAAQIAGLSRQSRAAYLRSIGWSESVAERFAAIQDATANQTVFRVQNVRLNWDREEGVKISSDFINFVTVRESPGPASEEQAAAAVQLAPTLPADVSSLVGTRTDRWANDLRGLYAQRETLTELRQSGALSSEEYDAKMEVLGGEIERSRAIVETGVEAG